MPCMAANENPFQSPKIPGTAARHMPDAITVSLWGSGSCYAASVAVVGISLVHLWIDFVNGTDAYLMGAAIAIYFASRLAVASGLWWAVSGLIRRRKLWKQREATARV